MRLLHDERGQSVQVGAAILLGFVVIAITMYQVEVVADQNAEVEFEHSQAVQDQLVDLRNDVTDVAGGGSSSSQTLTLGTSYPPRTIFINPSQPRGYLRTTATGQLRIRNATALEGPVNETWDGGLWTRSTRGLTYQPNYHEYGGAPTTILEHGHLYNHHPNGVNRSVTDQLLIDGNTISVITLRGNLSESTSGTVSVRSRAFSTSQNTVSVNSTNSSLLTMRLPTRSPEHWESILSDEAKVLNGSIAVDRSTTPSTITFQLEPDTYTLQMAEVGVGDAQQIDPANRSEYIVPIDQTAPTAVVEVRDALNNPVQNVEVEVEITHGASSNTRTVSTGSDGRAEVPDLDGGERVSVTVVDEPSVSRSFRAVSGGSTGGGAYEVNWTSDTGPFTVTAGSNEVTLAMETTPPAADARVEYAVDDPLLVYSGDWQEGYTNDSGEHSTAIPINTTELNERGGTATLSVFASSGGSGDRLDIELTQSGAPSPQAELRIEDMTHLNEGAVRFHASYELENIGSQYDRTAVRVEGPSNDLSEWFNNTNRRGTVFFSRGYGSNQQYDVTVYALDSDGDVITSRSISNVQANGQNPAGNDDLGDSGSPSATQYTITDQSSNQNGVQYQINWTATTANFGSVQLDAFSLDPDDGGRVRSSGQPASGSQTLGTYGFSPSAQQQIDFGVQITVYDVDGVIVDTVNVTDTADGSSP